MTRRKAGVAREASVSTEGQTGMMMTRRGHPGYVIDCTRRATLVVGGAVVGRGEGVAAVVGGAIAGRGAAAEEGEVKEVGAGEEASTESECKQSVLG